MGVPLSGTLPAGTGSPKALPIASIVLAVGGLLLLGWVTWSALKPNPLHYRYQLIAEGPVAEFPDLGLPDRPALSIRKYEIRADGHDQPLASLHVGRNAQLDRVLLDWQNQLTEPLFTLTASAPELAALTTAIATHLPRDSMLLGWWDTTRRLKLLSDIETPFDENLALPLLLPTAWSDQRGTIETAEQRFWQVPDDSPSAAAFERFQEALLADEATAVGIFRELAGNDNEVYLALHLSDAFKLGALQPERFGIGYRDFPNTGDLHSTIRNIKNWLREQGYKTYTAENRDANVVRVYFLTNAASENTLIAQALPFTKSQSMDLKIMRVVYQHLGYWVYKIPAADRGTDS